MTTILILGSMGWMPSAGQETACVLVELDDELVLLDAGTGVANLSSVEDVLARHGRLSVILSHYHLDHVAGLMYLKRFAANMCVDVYGPGRPVYERTTEDYMGDVLQRAVYSSGPHGFAREVRYHDYGGTNFMVGTMPVCVRPQHHSSASFELRLGDELVYATDTCFDANAWIDVRPAKALLHECWQSGAGDPRHTNAAALVAGLPRQMFERVLLIHQNPAWDARERTQVEDIAKAAGFELAHDGMLLKFPSTVS